MRHCARCNDFLNDHTCLSCNLRHQCLEEECECHKYPNLPFCFGHNYSARYGTKDINHTYQKIYEVNARDNNWNSKRYRDRTKMRASTRYEQLKKRLEYQVKEERTIHG